MSLYVPDKSFSRYMSNSPVKSDCMGIFFFKKGKYFIHNPDVWTPGTGMEPLDWIFAQMKVSIETQ